MRTTAGSICLAAAIFTAPWHAAAQDAPPRYGIKEDRPTTGSHITRDVVHGSMVRIDKPFLGLSAEEQARWKSQYENMAPNDVPPFPAEGLEPIMKAVAHAMKFKDPGAGPVSLLVNVDADGRATSVSVLSGSERTFMNDLAGILMLTKYTPGTCNGTPCAMEFPFRMTFGRR